MEKISKRVSNIQYSSRKLQINYANLKKYLLIEYMKIILSKNTKTSSAKFPTVEQ